MKCADYGLELCNVCIRGDDESGYKHPGCWLAFYHHTIEAMDKVALLVEISKGFGAYRPQHFLKAIEIRNPALRLSAERIILLR